MRTIVFMKHLCCLHVFHFDVFVYQMMYVFLCVSLIVSKGAHICRGVACMEVFSETPGVAELRSGL